MLCGCERDRQAYRADEARRDLSHILQCRDQHLRGGEVERVVLPEQEAGFSVDLATCSGEREGERERGRIDGPCAAAGSALGGC